MRLALICLLVAAASSAIAQGNSQNSQEILRQRLLLKERFNKGWEMETAEERVARCNTEGKRRYSAFHVMKRRKFVKNCIGRAGQ